MATYFLRRILLMVPTFLGSTVLVFTILQLAPGGPLEQTILQLQMGGMAGSGEGGVTSTDMVGGSALPASALKDLKRFYGFDKPIYQRYLIWLGLWPREIKHRDFTISSGQSQVEKRVGKKDGQIWRVDVKDNQDGSLMVYEKSGHQSDIWVATVEESKEDGTREHRKALRPHRRGPSSCRDCVQIQDSDRVHACTLRAIDPSRARNSGSPRCRAGFCLPLPDHPHRGEAGFRISASGQTGGVRMS